MAEDSPRHNYTVYAVHDNILMQPRCSQLPMSACFSDTAQAKAGDATGTECLRREQMDHRGGPMPRGALMSISVPALLTAMTNIATDHVSDGTCCLV